MLIGFSGKKLSGKTTAAKSLKGFTRLSFADPLRAILDSTNPLVKGDKRWSHFTYNEVKGRETGFEGRRLLQTLGESIKDIDPEFFVRAMRDRLIIEMRNSSVVIDDVRFESEAELIRSFGGIVIDLVNTSALADNDTHVSEVGIMADCAIYAADDDSLITQVREVVECGAF